MTRALIERHLALAERHVAEGREQLLRQKVILARLESDGRNDSMTAKMERKLLQSIQEELTKHVADRDRLQQQLNSNS